MTTPRNYRYIVATVVVYTFLVAAAAGSFTDIVKCAHMLGLHWQAWTVPFLLDGIALMGKLGRSAHFDVATQKAGLRLMLFGGTLSLAANVTAGTNTGERAFGALLVVGFLIVEWYATKLRPAQPRVSAVRSAAAVKAAGTRKANRAAKAAATPAAPVAPAPEPEPVVVPAQPVHAPTTTRTRRPASPRRAAGTRPLGGVANGWLTAAGRLAAANAA